MYPLEIISLILAIAILIKAVVFLVRGDQLLSWSEKLMKNTKLWLITEIIAAVIVGYFAFTYMAVVEVATGILFGTSLLAICLLAYPKAIVAFVKEMKKDKKPILLLFIPWVIFAIIVLLAIFV
jgi:hypothetical protein